MKTVYSAPTYGKKGIVAIDVDGTLILWDKDKTGKIGRLPRTGFYEDQGTPNAPLVERIKQWHAEGMYVIIWTKGGHEHAQWAALASTVTYLLAIRLS